jgi:hypothetical protein
MNWTKNDFVIHRTKSDWGVGKVLYVNANEIAVFFVGAGRKVFGIPAMLEPAPVGMSDHPLLKNVAPEVLEGTSIFQPLPHCVQHFLSLFPKGFDDPRYLSNAPKTGERHFKVLASKSAKESLNQSIWNELAAQGKYGEICQRLAKVESKTILLHSFEKIKWHAALKDSALQEPLCNALYDDLYGLADRESRFQRLADVLSMAEGCEKWTIGTYYGFLLHPAERIYIKPEVTKFAAEACGWDLQYDSKLNWNTLQSAEGMARYLFDILPSIGLHPRDMIDVQGFIWCIEPNSYA